MFCRDVPQRTRPSKYVRYTLEQVVHCVLSQGEAGDNLGALLRGVKREQLRRGMVVAAPGSIKPVKKFQAQIYVRCVFLWACMI